MNPCWVLFLALLAPNPALSQEPCADPSQEMSVIRVVASAAFWPNFWNSKDSIKHQMVEIYERAVEAVRLERERKQKSRCRDCSENQISEVILESAPGKFLSAYEGQAACLKQYELTRKTPLQFPEQEFPDMESVVSWFADFSRGYGEHGRLLYSQCDGECSPQYRLSVREDKSRLLVSTEVICGPARDRGDNSYLLSAATKKLSCAERSS